MHSTTPAPADQPPPKTLLVHSRNTLSETFDGCEHAQTLAAWVPNGPYQVIAVLPCNQWSCRHCAEAKIRKLAAKTRLAHPNRLLTLTVDPSLWESPRHAFDGTRRQLPRLIQTLRKKHAPIDYLRVTELTKRGYPHYHLLIRSPYLPHNVVQRNWQDLTGARIVDLRQVKQSFTAYTYLVKYLSKLHKIEWTERHVSYSRKFFPPDPPDPRPPLDLMEKTIHNQHPITFLLEYELGSTIEQLSRSLWRIHPKPTNEFGEPHDNPVNRPNL